MLHLVTVRLEYFTSCFIRVPQSCITIYCLGVVWTGNVLSQILHCNNNVHFDVLVLIYVLANRSAETHCMAWALLAIKNFSGETPGNPPSGWRAPVICMGTIHDSCPKLAHLVEFHCQCTICRGDRHNGGGGLLIGLNSECG